MKRVSILVISLILAVTLSAKGNKTNISSQFQINELIILPHIGKIIKMHGGEIEVTATQMQRLSKEVKQVFPPKFQALIREAFPIEKRVQRKVLKGATPEELKEDLDKIANLKREAISIKIEAFNAFKNIFTPTQWKKIVSLSKKQNS